MTVQRVTVCKNRLNQKDQCPATPMVMIQAPTNPKQSDVASSRIRRDPGEDDDQTETLSPSDESSLRPPPDP